MGAIQLDRRALSMAVREQLAEILGGEGSKEMTGYKHDVPSPPGSHQGIYAHGPNGALTYPGVDPDVYSTLVGNLPGLLAELTDVGTVYRAPVFEIFTGMKAGTGTAGDTVCDPAPIGGQMKLGLVTAPFGRFMRSTREIELGRLGQLNNRAEPMDLRLVNQWPATSAFGMSNDVQGNILTNEIDLVMFERAVEFHRLLSRQIWTGNPANNVGDQHQEFAGLALQINTTWLDAVLGTALPSLYPDVQAFSLKNVADDGTDLVRMITAMVRNRRDLASRTGMDPVRWVFVMKPNLFYELAASWVCAYYSVLCSTGGASGIQQNIDIGDQIALRDAMRNGRFLTVDGVRYEVILDDGIPEYSNTTKNGVVSGCFSSDIYFLPMSVMGGRAAMYLEHFRFDNASIQAALAAAPNGNVRTFGGGEWLEFFAATGTCWQWTARIEPRLVVRTPWLAGRVTDVQYCPLDIPRDPYPDSPYWVNGGTQYRPSPSLYDPWGGAPHQPR